MRNSKNARCFPGIGGLVVMVALAIALFAQAPAQASVAGPGGQTLSVTTTSDGGPGSLRQAIAEAQPGDTIALPGGTYVLTQGELKIEKELTIAGAGAAQTTIDGAGSSRALEITNVRPNTPVTISGVTITNADGSALLPEVGAAGGAAIASFEADLTLREDVITGNSTQAPAGQFVFGGAVLTSGGRFTMVDTTVTENLATVTRGDLPFGGREVIFGGAVSAQGTESTLVEDSKVVSNRAEAFEGRSNLVIGGGVQILSFGPVLIRGTTISGNVARIASGEVVGGGLEVLGEHTKLVADQLAGNVADAGSGTAWGGGLDFSGSGGIAGSVLENNRVAGAEGFGGNLLAHPGFSRNEHEITVSHTSVLHGLGPAGSENCATAQEATITSLGFNSESTDQCGFHAEGDQVNLG